AGGGGGGGRGGVGWGGPAVVRQGAELEVQSRGQVVPARPGRGEAGGAADGAVADVHRVGTEDVRPVRVAVPGDDAVGHRNDAGRRVGRERPGNPAAALVGGGVAGRVPRDGAVLHQQLAGEGVDQDAAARADRRVIGDGAVTDDERAGGEPCRGGDARGAEEVDPAAALVAGRAVRGIP